MMCILSNTQFIMGVLAQAKNGGNNFIQPMGRLGKHSNCLDFFFIFPLFPSSSHHVSNMFPRFPMCSPRVFPIAPCFNPICFAQSLPLLTYIGGPKGEKLHLSTKSSTLGILHGFNFFLLIAKK